MKREGTPDPSGSCSERGSYFAAIRRVTPMEMRPQMESPRQTPITLGKRKRREDPDEDDNVVDEQVAHLVMEDYELVDDGDRSL
ncbi:hypothetical protein HPB52_004539 [Rhipicephalus sanguineus]|uniref:Uncharacterized protein n=1 Tax=Rhipicephalus sanguineus TaxID=34632 RepID=A0A9D4PC61_RHISA|nr:hypothetical protein HPB52_004539 [Rhipicephalus sanguineus]